MTISKLTSISADIVNFLQGRRMNIAENLALLRDHGGKALWMYLDHLIYERGSTDPGHHLKLAILLIESLAEMLPVPDTRLVI
jgi:hypothetical protein